ncbi:MAG: hypothetical protein ACJAVR_003130 [Paracoccaceae bacterium]|jgi:hypothetical protein
MDRRSGGCLCGAVRFHATVEQHDFSACHCDACRRWGSGPFFAVAAADVVFEDDASLRRHRSSDWAERGFCATCGSSVFYRLVNQSDAAEYQMSVGALDDQSGLKLTQEVFVDRNRGAYAFAGPLTQLTQAECFARYAPKTEDD